MIEVPGTEINNQIYQSLILFNKQMRGQLIKQIFIVLYKLLHFLIFSENLYLTINWLIYKIRSRIE